MDLTFKCKTQLPCNASKDCATPTKSSDSSMYFMFLNQACPIILCGSDVIVYVWPLAFTVKKFF